MERVRKAQAELVNLGGMFSFKLFESWAFDNGYDEWLRSWIQPQWMAWLIYLLKELPDDSEFFLHGKWATIQRMEELLHGEVK